VRGVSVEPLLVALYVARQPRRRDAVHAWQGRGRRERQTPRARKRERARKEERS
jgi:hypothetical protein